MLYVHVCYNVCYDRKYDIIMMYQDYNDLCIKENKNCLYGFFRSTRELFTYIKTSPLPVKGCKF